MTDYDLQGIREEAKTLYETGMEELREMQRAMSDSRTGSVSSALAARRSAIAAELTKLETKLQRARALYEKLDGIRLTDPWSDGQALQVVWRNYTYLLLRVGGLWYSTGRSGTGAPYRFTWAQLVDWLVKADVAHVTELNRGQRVSLYQHRSAMHCTVRVAHVAHDFGEEFRCPGRTAASPDWAPPEWCGDQPDHQQHLWQKGEAREERVCPGGPIDVLGMRLRLKQQCPNREAHVAHLWEEGEGRNERQCPGILARHCGNYHTHSGHSWQWAEGRRWCAGNL